MNGLVDKLFNDNWPIRRRLLFVVLFWIAANVEWLIFIGLTALSVQLTITLVGAAVALIASYVFGATWDDQNKRMRLPRIELPEMPQTPASDAPCASETPSDARDDPDSCPSERR